MRLICIQLRLLGECSPSVRDLQLEDALKTLTLPPVASFSLYSNLRVLVHLVMFDSE